MSNNTETKQYRKFGMLDSLSYAAGDFGCNMSFALKGYLALFWNQFMGIDTNTYAILLLIVQVWDAINDPLIGSIVDADKRQYKRGKFLTYIWVGSIGLLFAGAFCFLPFPQAPAMLKNVLFIVGYILWDAFYTIANVPYGSLLSLISKDPGDRASLSAWRSVGSMVGNMLCMAIIPMLIYDENDNIKGEVVFWAALALGLAGFVAFQFMIRTTVIRCDEYVQCNEEQEKFNVVQAMGNFMKNRPAVGATVAAMGMFLGMQGAATGVQVMFQAYFQNASIQGLVSMFAMLPIILFTPLARKMVAKFGKKELATVGSIVSIIACVGLCVLPIGPNGTGMIIYVACQLVNSLGMGIYSTVSWSMMGDAIDYAEWKFGKREEGTVYSLHSFFRKLAQGAGPSICLVIMALPFIGYDNTLKADQTMEVATNIRYFVAVAYLVSAVLQFVGLGLIYNLDKKSLAKMNEELEARHANN
ncbi:MAG: MFS transporter [Agathobacter sp.]|nr:MFS transporter [Agathobacter sp.]